MRTNSCFLQIGGMEVLVVRKPIKNIYLSVLPSDGTVRVTAPLRMKDDVIRTFVGTRILWIRKWKAKFEAQKRHTPRAYVSGESHYFFGKRYRLEVVYEDNPPRARVHGKHTIMLHVRPQSALVRREEALLDWYRRELHLVADKFLEEWRKKIGVRVGSWSIKRMKTRWGTCNQPTGRIRLNLELVKKPLACVEYVIVHELLHLIEKRHNKRFADLLTKHLPAWRSRKKELNRFLLGTH